MSTITMDDAHVFAQGLIANGWLNSDPDCVDTLYRQLVAITMPPRRYESALHRATPAAVQADQATGVKASWSDAKSHCEMQDAGSAQTKGAPAERIVIPPRHDISTSDRFARDRQTLQDGIDKCADTKNQRKHNAN